MLINLCRIGNSVFHMGGLPIGGVLSKIAASYVLGHEEQLWAHDFAKRSSLGFAASSGSWACEVACARYVDDLFWVSTVYCHSCMAAALPHIYSAPFTVEPEACVVKWLDLHFSCTSLSWSMAFPPCWGAEKNFLRRPLFLRLSLGYEWCLAWCLSGVWPFWLKVVLVIVKTTIGEHCCIRCLRISPDLHLER